MFPQRSRPALLMPAAWGGLKSAPDSRLRRASRHLLYSLLRRTEVQPRLRGRSVLVRSADDVVIVVEQESDAHRMLAVLPKRLGWVGLPMHPEKSRLVRFRRPRLGWRPGQDGDRFPPPGTFDFHVVHIWHKWLNRRSQQRSMPWTRFLRLLARYPLPRMTAAHFATGV